MGAIKACSYSVRAIKEYSRQAAPAPKFPNTTAMGTPLVFTKTDTIGLDMPHNDAIVVELLLDDVEVSRILIDTGSSVNMIFKDALDQLDQLDLRTDKIKPFIGPLTGFDGEHYMTVGTVKFLIYLAGVAKIIKFLILDKPAIYNAILGKPWLHVMKAVASSFPPLTAYTPSKLSKYNNRPHHPEVKTKTRGHHPSLPRYRFGIGSELDPKIQESLVPFLKQHSSTFAQSVEDMPGINSHIACHELNIDPTYKLIKQK
ncbi:uncharacterized protein LOC112082077 [Eutrema salsugineum]|uniref:uncharacterized protein LOC112082077 n=1 Tax=Eutrema salsugineum TaxID=72664 RepID=UPI000CED2D00|nr:uncharacterized protein LOC112082077 [Eutrema salsugineum]